jgi:hypothetical protein
MPNRIFHLSKVRGYGIREGIKMSIQVEVEVEIIVDKEEIEANEFVQGIIGRAIAGAVSSLRGVKEEWKEIEIRVRSK